MKPIETRRTEIHYITSDPERMLNKFIARRVIRTWTEEYIDKDTREPVAIERSNRLFDKGTYIDDDILTQIRFWMEEGSVKEVEVSNQKRMSFVHKNSSLFPYKCVIRMDDKKKSYLLYATSAMNAIEIVTDYVELNCNGGFMVVDVRELDNFIVLIDRLKQKSVIKDGNSGGADSEDGFSVDEYLNQVTLELEAEEEEKDESEKLKFYQIKSRVVQSDGYGDEEQEHTFVVNTFNCTLANLLIEKWLRDCQEKRYLESLANPDSKFEKKDIHAFVEESKIVPFGCFIPLEFSLAYKEDTGDAIP